MSASDYASGTPEEKLNLCIDANAAYSFQMSEKQQAANIWNTAIESAAELVTLDKELILTLRIAYPG